MLASGDKAVAELAASLPVTRSAVSQHLAVMGSVGLVSEEHAGRQHRYRLHREPLEDVRLWPAALDHSGRSASVGYDHLDGASASTSVSAR